MPFCIDLCKCQAELWLQEYVHANTKNGWWSHRVATVWTIYTWDTTWEVNVRNETWDVRSEKWVMGWERLEGEWWSGVRHQAFKIEHDIDDRQKKFKSPREISIQTTNNAYARQHQRDRIKTIWCDRFWLLDGYGYGQGGGCCCCWA